MSPSPPNGVHAVEPLLVIEHFPFVRACPPPFERFFFFFCVVVGSFGVFFFFFFCLGIGLLPFLGFHAWPLAASSGGEKSGSPFHYPFSRSRPLVDVTVFPFRKANPFSSWNPTFSRLTFASSLEGRLALEKAPKKMRPFSVYRRKDPSLCFVLAFVPIRS